jgi:hypothetical protein
MLNALQVFMLSNIFTKYTLLAAFVCKVQADNGFLLQQYVYKGPDRASVSVHPLNGPDPSVSEQQMERDEIKLYVDARYISASEAFAPLMGWDTHRVRSESTIRTKLLFILYL